MTTYFSKGFVGEEKGQLDSAMIWLIQAEHEYCGGNRSQVGNDNVERVVVESCQDRWTMEMVMNLVTKSIHHWMMKGAMGQVVKQVE